MKLEKGVCLAPSPWKLRGYVLPLLIEHIMTRYMDLKTEDDAYVYGQADKYRQCEVQKLEGE